MNSFKKSVIIVAAGSAQRMQLNKNKIFLNVCGQSVIARSVNKFLDFHQIVIVVKPSEENLVALELQNHNIADHNIVFAYGGQTRSQSVSNGLSKLSPCDVVLVHDAARPFTSKQDIQRLVETAKQHQCAILAHPVVDTVKQVDANQNIIQTIDRETIYLAQTPQAFDYHLLLKAYDFAQKNQLQTTDDSALMELLGHKVKIVPSTNSNIKITTQEDIPSVNFRIGQGYDVHQLVEGRKCILCGVNIPFEKGLLGHSDADVATHALMDALLGALALGDIGQHFPDTDNKFKNANSITLLKEVYALIQSKGFHVINVDLTIMAQAPKIAPHIPAMRQMLSETLHISIEQVSIKATTTEKLGFVGREEGIACTAVCMLQGGENAIFGIR